MPERGALCGRSDGGEVQKDLMRIKVAKLKEELEARGEAKAGAKKAWLQAARCNCVRALARDTVGENDL